MHKLFFSFLSYFFNLIKKGSSRKKTCTNAGLWDCNRIQVSNHCILCLYTTHPCLWESSKHSTKSNNSQCDLKLNPSHSTRYNESCHVSLVQITVRFHSIEEQKMQCEYQTSTLLYTLTPQDVSILCTVRLILGTGSIGTGSVRLLYTVRIHRQYALSGSITPVPTWDPNADDVRSVKIILPSHSW